MKWTRLVAPAATVIALGMGADVARADDLKATARAVAQKVQKAIVTARLVVKVTVGEREQDVKLEVTGTVIDPSGLTVVSASQIDPTAALGGAGARGRRGGQGGGGGGGEQMRVESEVTETALVTEDGTEIDSDVVLKDAELDLAFIRPRDKGLKMDYVEIKANDKAPQMLDDVFVVGRLGRAGNHAIAISTGTVKSVVKGPHAFYVCDAEVSAGNHGCIAYAADGTPLGIFVTKTARAEGAQGGGPGARGRGGESSTVVRPTADLIDLAGQAKNAKAPEKKEKDDEDAPKKDAPKAPDKPAKPAPDNGKKGDDF
jgi:hypothetical protein